MHSRNQGGMGGGHWGVGEAMFSRNQTIKQNFGACVGEVKRVTTRG